MYTILYSINKDHLICRKNRGYINTVKIGMTIVMTSIFTHEKALNKSWFR